MIAASEQRFPVFQELSQNQLRSRDPCRDCDEKKNGVARTSTPAILAQLKSCRSEGELKKVHEEILKGRCDGNIFVANTLVDMYAKCGSLENARSVFDGIKQRSVVSWNAIIKGYAHGGQEELALELFARMQENGFEPDPRTFVAALNACAGLATKEEGRKMDGKMAKVVSLERGMAFHKELSRGGFESNSFLSSALLDLYVKCEALEDARRVFDRIRDRTVASWNVMILGHAENEQGEQALELFSRMQHEGMQPDTRTFLSVIIACTSLATSEAGKLVQGKLVKAVSLEKGMALHSLLTKHRQDTNLFVGSTLVSLYAKCGSMVDAYQVFEKMRERDVVLWTALILGFAENDEGEVALELFSCLQYEKQVTPDSRTYVAALRACSSLAAKEESQKLESNSVKARWLETGFALHSVTVEVGHDGNLFVANTLIDMYAKCGSMENAQLVFDRMPKLTVVSWTTMVWGYVQSGESKLALSYFEYMQAESFIPDAQAYLPALMACACLAEKEVAGVSQGDGKLIKVLSLEKGMAIHSRARSSGYEFNVFVATALIDMYAKCGSPADAKRVFESMKNHSTASWNSMIMLLAENGEEEAALNLFQRMQDERFEPDSRTYTAALSACSGLAAAASTTASKHDKQDKDSQNWQEKWLETGMKLHSRAAKLGFDSDSFVANTLVDMYSKCECMEMARRVFETMQQRTVVSWNAIISGYVEAGESRTALELFQRMQQQQRDLAPNVLTYVPVLKACASLASLEAGKRIHRAICDAKLLQDSSSSETLLLANSLIIFYGKCGSMAEAEEVFASIQARVVPSTATWNSLLAGYSHCGDSKAVLETFERMKRARVAADGATFLWILSACSHAGIVDEGKLVFKAMSEEFGIVPSLEHYNCLVDILGRANFLDESVEVVKAMPLEPDSTVWKTLLSACIKWKCFEIGKMAFQRLVKLDENDSAAYVLMANLVSQCEMYDVAMTQ